MNERNGAFYAGMLFSFITGALVGAAASMLLTPKTGRESRQYIGDKFDDLKDQFKKLEDRVKKQLEKI